MATITENLLTIQSSLADIKTAIVGKGVTVDGDITTYADKIASIETGGSGGGTTPSRPQYTGHADADGLRAIGWTDDDIAYYQANGVNWNEEDDQYHLVTDDNKALYGVLTASNISTYKDRIVYLPKIDTSGVTYMGSMFSHCRSLVAIPQLDTSSVVDMGSMFYYCSSLVSIPQLDTSNVVYMGSMFFYCSSLVSIPLLDTSKVTDMESMFQNCYSFTTIPLLDTGKVTNMDRMFNACYSLKTIPLLDTSNVTNMERMFSSCISLTSLPQLDTSRVTTMSQMFNSCYSLTSLPQLDTSRVTTMSQMFSECYSLTTIPRLNTSSVTNMYNISYNNFSLMHLYINNMGSRASISISSSPLITKESLLYIINNEAATSARTITLHSYAYTRLAEDADVVAALANHPNISLASA